MKKLILPLALLFSMTGACADATAAAKADALSVPTETLSAQSVVFRQTQRLYCAKVQEDIVLYRNGSCLVKIKSDPNAYEGTYRIIDENRKIVISLSDYSDNIYCDVSIRYGSIVRLECNGNVYYPKN